MSYDFHLFTPQAGVDPQTIAARDEEGERGPRNPKFEERKRKLANLLIAHDPRLELAKRDFDEIAALYKMPVAEAHERMRHMELNDTASPPSGVQILLFDDGAALSIPYWHKGADARRVLGRAWSYLDVICNESGYEVFDPQQGRVIGVNSFEEILTAYAGATARMDDMIGRVPKKPWWKFW